MTKVDYSQLYYRKEVQVLNKKIKDYPIELSIETKDFQGRPDCKVGHFGYNFYLRTKAGFLYREYKSERMLELYVEKMLKRNGFEILKWITKEIK